MLDKQLALITSVVRRAPEWSRHNLLARIPLGDSERKRLSLQ